MPMNPTTIAALALILAPASSRAHDLETLVNQAPPAVIVRCAYAATDPAAYAAVLVYRPNETETEYQNGRTDANGVFSFVPDRAGEWLFVVDDELGHRVEVRIPVEKTAAGMTASSSPAPLTTSQKLFLGLAAVLGLTGLAYGYTARRPAR
jgi:nickel transport protein